MKRSQSGCIALIILVGGILGLLILGGLYYYISYAAPNALAERRLLEGPPTILARSPQAGDRVAADGILSAEATITGSNPIARVELWMDGAPNSTAIPDSTGSSVFNAFIELQVPEGTHLVYWRAVDRSGLVGQTTPVPIIGEVVPVIDEPSAAALPAAPNQGGTAPGASPPLPNAPTPPLPQPSAGSPRLELASVPLIDLSTLIPSLLRARPAAPSHLQAGFEPCTVRLVWNDNAENEDRFDIWMQALGGPPIKIRTTTANPGTGSTWFEFDSPSFGIYSFWVEAANGLGSQPSEIAWIAVNDAGCGEGVASQLEIEVLGMRVTGDHGDNMYCYLSVEGWPEKRVPEDDSEFLHPDASGGVNIYTWLGGQNRILLKMPADEDVTLAGDCWAWLGNTARSMGPEPFSGRVPRDQWDNRTVQVRTSGYVIDLRIRPFGSTRAEGVFGYLDYGIPRPEGVRLEPQTSTDPLLNADMARTPIVRWTWNGDPSDITGFAVHVDGALASWVPDPNATQHWLILPSTCGSTVEIQVAAQSDLARSPFSDSVFYSQPPCPIVAEVRFLTAWSEHTDDTSCAFPDISSCFHYATCDGLGIWYRLWAVNTVRKEIRAGTPQRPLHYRCGVEHEFTNQLAAETDTILIPIDPTYLELRIGSEFWEGDLGPNDRFGVTFHKFLYSYDQWAQVDEDVELTAPFMDGTADMVIRVHVRGYRYPGP